VGTGPAMRGRPSSVVIALRNAPGGLPLVVLPAVLAGWAVGVALLPGPQGPLVRWLSALAAAGGLAALAGHFLDALSLRHEYPPLVVLGGAVCLPLGAFCLWREPSGALLFRLGLPLLLTGLLWSYTFYFSVLRGAQRVSRLRVGDRFPDFTLPDSEGRAVSLASVVARGPALLLFYKGDW
jgi:hypothetical protein